MKKCSVILICVVLACAAFGAPAEETPFKTVGDADRYLSYLYASEDYYVVLAEKDGVWWRVDAQLDDRYRELYAWTYDGADPAAAHDEMTAYARSLPVASAEILDGQPLSDETLRGYSGKKMKDLLADGFEFDWAQGFTADEQKADGRAIVLRPAGADGTVYRVPFYPIYTGPLYEYGLMFNMSMGIYSYQFNFAGTDKTLTEAVENGTWEEMKIVGEGCFSGFSSEMCQSLWEDVNARLFPTAEEAAAVQTVRDAMKYDYFGWYSDNCDEYYILINGTDRFWLAAAKLDGEHRDLARKVISGNADEEERDLYWEYEISLPVAVKALDGDHPPVPDVSACAGKTIRELQEEGFRIYWFFATTADPAKEEYNKTLSLPDAGGEKVLVNGYFSYDDFNEYCLIDVVRGAYQFTVSLDGTAETLEAAVNDGTFQDLTIREITYSGVSPSVADTLGLR